MDFSKRIRFNPEILKNYFQDSVRIACTKCKRYGISAACPPYLKSIEYYRKLLSSKQVGLLVINRYEITDLKKWKKLGRDSSEDLRLELIRIKTFIKTFNTASIIFGAGSCKACKVCTIPCSNPIEAIIPIEGLGINVIRLVKAVAGIQIKFPVEKQGYFYRVGMVLYND